MRWLRWLRHGTYLWMAASLPFSLLTNWKNRSLEFLLRTCFDFLQLNCMNLKGALTLCQVVLTLVLLSAQRNCVDQQHSFYVSWAPRFTLPPEQFEKAYKVEFDELSKTNPVVRQFTPALPRFRWAEAYEQTRRALLHSAIAVRLEGPKVLNQHLDPYDQKPFTYTALDGGFRLESRLTDGEIPISLSILPNSEERKT